MTPQEAEELEQSTILFHGALVALGAQSIIDSLDLWQDVPPLPTVGGSRAAQRWLETAAAYVAARRIQARDMALAYYRYQRALATGTTIALPGQEPGPPVSLFELKREFETLIGASTEDEEDPEALEAEGDIEVEAVEGLEEDLESAEEEAARITRENLRVLGPGGLERKLTPPSVRNEDEPIDIEQVDRDRIAAHASAGRRQAAAAERNVLNGGRGSLFLAGGRDKKALGFVRVSRTGTPCGFCAMLISRGPVLKENGREPSIYASNEGTGLKANGEIVTYGDLDLYHDNCHCYAVPVFSLEQFKTADVFALNRRYAELWPVVTEGLGGEDALSAWRRFIREEAKSRKSQEAAA